MNKIIIYICTFMFLASCTESSQVKYIIKGTTANITDGEKIYLKSVESDKVIIDSTTIIDNSFTFKGKQLKQCFASISLDEMSHIFILEDGTINVTFDKHGKVVGTPTNNILNACNEKISMFDEEMRTLSKKRCELKEEQKDELAAWEKKWGKFLDKRNAVIKECINQNSNNLVSIYLLTFHANTLADEEISKLLDKISPAMKGHCFVKRFIELQEGWKRTEIGQKFTDFKLKDPNDKEVSLSDYIGKGKYVLIDFWASWCGPCRGEMPNVKAAYEKFKSKGFEIVGVSLDFKKEDWMKGIKDLCITWPQMSDLKNWECEGAKIYGIRAIPSTLLIDPNGIIIAKNLRGEAIEKKLSELLN